jgi:hypothetical protein
MWFQLCGELTRAEERRERTYGRAANGLREGWESEHEIAGRSRARGMLLGRVRPLHSACRPENLYAMMIP